MINWFLEFFGFLPWPFGCQGCLIATVLLLLWLLCFQSCCIVMVICHCNNGVAMVISCCGSWHITAVVCTSRCCIAVVALAVVALLQLSVLLIVAWSWLFALPIIGLPQTIVCSQIVALPWPFALVDTALLQILFTLADIVLLQSFTLTVSSRKMALARNLLGALWRYQR